MVAAVPIVATILTSINTIMTSINVVSTLGRENHRLQGEIEGSLGQLKREVAMAEWDMAKYEGANDNLTLQMQELLCDIEDFTSDLSIPDKAAAFLDSLLARDPRPREIELIKNFLASIKSIGDRQKKYSKAGNNDATNLVPAPVVASTPRYYAPEKDLDEGFPEIRKEFEELLLSPAAHDGQGQLRLISIVGCSGLGKTALARVVYETIIFSPATQDPPCLPSAEIYEVVPANGATCVHQSPTANKAIPVLQTPPITKIYESFPANGATPVRPSLPTTEINEPITATFVPPFSPTKDIHEPVTTNNESNPVCLSPPMKEIYKPLNTNGATSLQPSPRTTQINQPVEATPILPSPPITKVHELVTANEAIPIRPPPPIAEIQESNAFNCKAWVQASTCTDTEDLLTKVLNALGRTAARWNDAKNAIKEILLDKRYLIIIDDLRSHGVKWRDIEHAFPENCKGSRIIVTTSVHSIARDYSSGSYYVYPMKCIDKTNSEGLFWKNFFGPFPHRHPSAPERALSTRILAKCGGLPLSVISAGNYLCWKDRNPYLSDDLYKEVCEELHNIGDMRRMFAQCYKDLSEYDHKNCLLYLSIFPRGHEINSNRFMRRLKSEALVAGDVLKCLKNLLDKSLIEPSLTHNSCHVAKMCQVQSMMLEFAIHKSVSRNLVTLINKGIVLQNKLDGQIQCEKKVRRLTVQSGSSDKEGSNSSSSLGVIDYSSEEESSCSIRNNLIPDEINMSAVRSLTIFRSNLLHPPQNMKGKSKLPPNSMVDFESSKMIRLLDLEGCEGLNTVIGDICEMLFLKYLSLRNTDLEKLPTAIGNLKRLWMLDIRQTRVEILTVEVIMLPELTDLLGEFEIPQLRGREEEDATKFLKEKSKLETLAGIVIKERRGFEMVIRNARNLKKVKLYGNKLTALNSTSKRTSLIPKKFSKLFRRDTHSAPTSSAPSSEHKRMAAVLVSSLRKRFLDLDSISIESDCISRDFLSSTHKASSVISSLKLRGPLTSISGCTLEKLCNLNKLHLFSTGLRIQDLVRALQSLTNLQYLKLSEEDGSKGWEGDFSAEKGKFSALLELSFEGTLNYPPMKIAEGAMEVLKSLQLLYPHPVMVVQGMEYLKLLDEVILHHTADVPTLNAWKEAARNHINMPCVKKQPAQPTSNAA